MNTTPGPSGLRDVSGPATSHTVSPLPSPSLHTTTSRQPRRGPLPLPPAASAVTKLLMRWDSMCSGSLSLSLLVCALSLPFPPSRHVLPQSRLRFTADTPRLPESPRRKVESNTRVSTELPKCFFKKNSSKQKKKCLKQETTVRCYTYLMGYVTERERPQPQGRRRQH